MAAAGGWLAAIFPHPGPPEDGDDDYGGRDDDEQDPPSAAAGGGAFADVAGWFALAEEGPPRNIPGGSW